MMVITKAFLKKSVDGVRFRKSQEEYIIINVLTVNNTARLRVSIITIIV